MAESKPVTIRIPDAWLVQIENLAAQKYPGRKGNPNKSQVILDAVEFYLQHLNNDGEYNVNSNDTVFSANKLELQKIVNLAVEQQIEKLALSLKQSIAECLTTFTEAKPEQIAAILQSQSDKIFAEVLPKPEVTQPDTPANKQEFDQRKLTRHQMYQYLDISSRTLDVWIRKAKAESDPPIIFHQGKSWRYIPSGKGLTKVFVLIED